jgi:hypothetical protein
MPDVIDQVKYLISRYDDRYKLYQGAVEWDDEDFEEIGPRLKAHITKSTASRKQAIEKVEHLMALLDDLEKDGGF